MKRIFMFMILLAVCVGCARPSSIRMATTTSTENSGLLDYLLPIFTTESGMLVDVIAVGTGKALKLGENGDVDVVLVHARKAEEAFVAAGFGLKRFEVMYNDFVVLGPNDDPLRLLNSRKVISAFKKLGKGQASFASRGDNSGTHIREIALWELAGVQPEGSWYLEAGQGMGATLKIADEKQAYCLADRGTYLALKDEMDLKICYEGGDDLVNMYGIIAVDPNRHKHVKALEADTLIKWMVSSKGQQAIDAFRVKGERLFNPVELKGSDGLK